MRARGSLLLSDADQIRRRADDHLLQMSGMRSSVERELTCGHMSDCRLARVVQTWITVLIFYVLTSTASASESVQATPSFSLVAFICVWKRPLLTEFVLSHYERLRESLVSEDIQLHIFVVGSENSSTALLAQRFSAAFAVHPNSPLGAKHDHGIQSLRTHFCKEVSDGRITKLPDSVAVFGSDDIVNQAFFTTVRDVMAPSASPRSHMVGLRDIFFYDLKSRQLAYTKGYRSFRTQISGTLGCGRVYSWSLLEALNWHLWDVEREHGLDQSATRNMMRKVPMIEEVSTAVLGRAVGVIAVDIKSDGYRTGTNIWKFDDVVEAVGRNGRFHEFEYEKDEGILHEGFGRWISDELNTLRRRMSEIDSE